MLSRYLNEDEIRLVEEAGYGVASGLRYTLEELGRTRPMEMTREELAEYADAVTFAKVMVDDHAFFAPQLASIPSIPPGQTIAVSTTGLGNLALIARNMKHAETREMASMILDQILQAPVKIDGSASC